MRRDDPRTWRTARDKDGNAYVELPNRGTAASRSIAGQMGVAIDSGGIITISEQTLLQLTIETMRKILSGRPSKYDARRWVLLRKLCTDEELEQVADVLGVSVPG